MSNILKVKVIESKHHLLDNVDGLLFREMVELAESLEQLAALYDF